MNMWKKTLLDMGKKYVFILVPIIALFLCSIFFFTSLDNKIFDLFLRAAPGLTEDRSVLIITVDDDAIANVGIFPWSRDILADAAVFLREMGADTAVFDLSYLDRSPMRVDPEYTHNTLPGILDDEFQKVNNSIAQIMDALSSGDLGLADLGEYKEQLFEYTQSVRNNIGEAVSYISRDVDEYFAQRLKFFGKSYLALTMITPKDIQDTASGDFHLAVENLPYLEERIALKNINTVEDTLTVEQPGILPPISPLLSRAEGAGFVNAEPDSDGNRRRIHLVLKHGGSYYGHLALAALRNMIGSPEIVVTNSAITLKGANVHGAVRDIRIPRTRDGTVLIKWPKKPFAAYNTLSSWQLIRYTRIENEFIRNLTVMESSGFFYYLGGGPNPLDFYLNAQSIMREISAEDSSLDQSGFDRYRTTRLEYLAAADSFLNGNAETRILEEVAGNGQLEDFVKNLFGEGRKQLSTLMDIRKEVGEKVQGTFAIIGTTGTSMTDNGIIAFEERFPNVGSYAAVTNMILSGEFLDDTPYFVSLFIALALSLGLGILIHRLKDVGKSITAGVLVIALNPVFFLLFFVVTKRYIGMAVPFISVTLTFLSLQAISYFKTAKEKQAALKEKAEIRSAFSLYLAPSVIDQLIADPSRLKLGGEKKVMTAIFTDLRSFSTITEALGEENPEKQVQFLNYYLTRMSNVILENRGTLDKYEGDAIIAFFGAPIDMADHAVMACRSAIMMKRAEVEINKGALEQGLVTDAVIDALLKRKIITEEERDRPIFTRIGINSGAMMVGNMGTTTKMDYTVMGNAVNLASRLEGVNKEYNTGGILVSEYTRKLIGDEFILRSLDRVRVKGINTPLRLYELLEERENASPELLDSVKAWEEALAFYENRKYSEAINLFRLLVKRETKDAVAELYLYWCEQFLNNPPGPNFDGVHDLS
jgi:adenylate cyclase